MNQKLTRLIKCVRDEKESGKEGGEWVPDLDTQLEWSDMKDHSNSWHIVRERPNFGTIEIRLLPSWPLETLEPAVKDVHDFVRFALDIAPKAVGITSYAEMRQSQFWRYLCSYKIGGERRLPLDYDKNKWNAHVFS